MRMTKVVRLLMICSSQLVFFVKVATHHLLKICHPERSLGEITTRRSQACPERSRTGIPLSYIKMIIKAIPVLERLPLSADQPKTGLHSVCSFLATLRSE